MHGFQVRLANFRHQNLKKDALNLMERFLFLSFQKIFYE